MVQRMTARLQAAGLRNMPEMVASMVAVDMLVTALGLPSIDSCGDFGLMKRWVWGSGNIALTISESSINPETEVSASIHTLRIVLDYATLSMHGDDLFDTVRAFIHGVDAAAKR